MAGHPIAMAMHIHASFSEGTASYEAHLAQARAHGVEVIWWTDHDFRVAAHGHRRAVRFDGESELEGELEWSWSREPEGELAAADAEFGREPRPPDDPGGSLRLRAVGGAGGGALWLRGTAWNWTYSTSLADTTLEFDVLADHAEDGAVFGLEIQSSYHPARAGRPAGQYVVQYRIGGSRGPRHRAEGLLGIVELPASPGQWQRFTVRPVDDVATLWPDLVAVDNSLHQLRVGVIADEGRSGRFVLGRLRFERDRNAGKDGLELRRAVLAEYADDYADITHYESLEVSLVRHLNWFGGTLTIPSLPSPPYRDNDADLAAAMVGYIHDHGGLAQWNHPLDCESPESLARLMIGRDKLGADLVEIGRGRLDEMLWVLDTVARNAIVFTGVGVSDDHAGRDWLDQTSAWITCVYAASTKLNDLLDALRVGAAFFCDPAHWRGELNVLLDGQPAMGAVVVTDADSVPVQLIATEPPASGALEVIVGRVDYAGVDALAPAYESRTVPAAELTAGEYQLSVEVGDGAYVRTQVRDGDGAVVGVSNPLWLLRSAPAGMLDSPRVRGA